MIYLNNAATTYPKPACVLEAHAQALAAPPASQYRDAGGGPDPFTACRENLGRLLGIQVTDRIFFTSGATEALNILLRGLPLRGGRVAVTPLEHNSVLRPLYNTALEPVMLPCDALGRVQPADVAALPEDCTLLVVNHCSNVTGAVQDMAALAYEAHRRGMLFLADVSQSAGCLPVCADEWGADALAFTGHKALYGPQGTGGFYVRPGVALRPLLFGGTGRDSAKLIYQEGEYEYEAGTQNAPGVAALNAGVGWVLGQGVTQIARQEAALSLRLRQGLADTGGVTLYGPPGGGPVVSFTLAGLTPADAAYILHGTYGIVLRSGLQCAPLIHHRLGTEKGGVLRASFSCFTTEADVDALLAAVRVLAGGKDTFA